MNSTARLHEPLMRLPHYGVHNIGGLYYLFQDNLHTGWNFVGSKHPSNATVKHLSNTCPHCFNPHQMNVKVSNKHWDKFLSIIEDPLVRMMLPLPPRNETKAVYLEQGKLPSVNVLFSVLERLNNPLHHQTRAVWAHTTSRVARALLLTNIHPMPLYGGTMQDADAIRKMLTLAMDGRRRLIIEGTPELLLPEGTHMLDTNLSSLMPLEELVALPLEHLGLEVLSRYFRGELPGDWRV